MDTEEIVDAIDTEIARLTHARNLLTGSHPSLGYPTGTEKRTYTKRAVAPAPAKKRMISPEGRARIAAAQKLRWAAAQKLKR